MRFQRATQALTLAMFVGLFLMAVHPWCEGKSVDFFLRLDPLIATGSVLAAREFRVALLPGLIVVVSALLMGRVFCGHICPMGTTLDVLDFSVERGRGKRTHRHNACESSRAYRGWKYVILAVILGAACGGVSLVFLGSPLSLVTRVYALVFHPVVLLVSDAGLARIAPVIDRFASTEFTYLSIGARVYATNVFVAAAFAGIAALAYVSPRFWCRHLCPAGALLGLFSQSPLLKRRVSNSCTRCGRCMRECPTSAIGDDPAQTAHEECIVCLRCVQTCPVSAISFSKGGVTAAPNGHVPDFTRRGMVLGVGSGLITSAVTRTGIYQPAALGREKPLRDGELLRPPGSLPEPEFLALCVRCGECMKACPTNTLQPIWLKAGFEGLFTPVLVPRLAACAVECAACGQVCPTGAIRPLPLVEKKHAKLGTAWIAREYCLAWERNKKCLVCDEMCPYKAISLKAIPGHEVAVPFVQANKCAGCGWCESKCPVQGVSAIRVSIDGEIRLQTGSYVGAGHEYGLELQPRTVGQQHAIHGAPDESLPSNSALPSSDSQSENLELPPGFSPK